MVVFNNGVVTALARSFEHELFVLFRPGHGVPQSDDVKIEFRHRALELHPNFLICSHYATISSMTCEK